MPKSEEQKEKDRIYQREWYKKNKEKKNKQSKENYNNNKEKTLKRHSEWREKNPNYYKTYGKNYRDNNPEKEKERHLKYSKTEEAQKKRRIGTWRRSGLVDNYEFVYKRYIETNNCDRCYIELNFDKINNHSKVMDHNHLTGQFRGIMCNLCNLKGKELRK